MYEEKQITFYCFFKCFYFVFSMFFISSSMVQNGAIPDIEFSSSIQGILTSIMFLPLIISMFFLAQHLKSKSGIWQNVYKVLNFISIALFCYMVIILFFSFLG